MDLHAFWNILEHSGMHSGTFWNILECILVHSGTFWNILECNLEHAGTFWNALDLSYTINLVFTHTPHPTPHKLFSLIIVQFWAMNFHIFCETEQLEI